jgi:hypothetical protein
MAETKRFYKIGPCSEATVQRQLKRSDSAVRYSSNLTPIRNDFDGFLVALASNPKSVLNKSVIWSYSQK